MDRQERINILSETIRLIRTIMLSELDPWLMADYRRQIAEMEAAIERLRREMAAEAVQ